MHIHQVRRGLREYSLYTFKDVVLIIIRVFQFLIYIVSSEIFMDQTKLQTFKHHNMHLHLGSCFDPC